MSLALRLEQDRLYLNIYLQPKASRDQFLGLHGDELKVAITAPPIDGKANAHLLKWLAKQCRVAKFKVQLVAGDCSRHKRVVIESPKEIPPALAELLAKST
ncbi:MULTISPECIES: DUF167 family protein YggU [Oceanisphaera]|uniref:UPF0235 protein ACFQ1C_01740 n=1 Tax=Oceanisphaera ostreae TaxID=914151 RepID=A0ABW3KCP4_9GAMM